MSIELSKFVHVKLPNELPAGLHELEGITGIQKNTLIEIALKIGLSILIRETGTHHPLAERTHRPQVDRSSTPHFME